MSIYATDLDQNSANFSALSPISFLRRAAQIYPHRLASVYGERQFTWGETWDRCVAVASALQQKGIGQGDTVAILCANLPEMFEAHFAVPMTGAVLNAINIRLDAATVQFILEHGEAKLFLVDREFGPVAEQALAGMTQPPEVIHIDDVTYAEGSLLGEQSYQDLVDQGWSATGPVPVDASDYLPTDGMPLR